MTSKTIPIKFEGAAADKHKIDAFELAQTISGFGEVISHSLHLLDELEVAEGKHPDQDAQILISAINSGSFELIYELVREIPPMLTDFLDKDGMSILWKLMEYSFRYHKDKGENEIKNDSESRTTEVPRKVIDHFVQSRDKLSPNKKKKIKDEESIREVVEKHAIKSQPAIKDTIKSIGSTTKTLHFPSEKGGFTINEQEAKWIRLSPKETLEENMEVKETNETLICTMDGIIEHNNTIKIQIKESPDPEKYFTAKVEDEEFGSKDNTYITGLNEKKNITVEAKVTRKGGEITHLVIYSALIEK